MKEKRFDAIALGELLIDFTQNGVSDRGNLLMEANPGGAPCNVLAMLCKFGKKTAFIGKVGDDMFGKLLKETLAKLNINSENLITDKEVPTTLAFVRTLPGGERDFSFYRNPGADMMLREDEVSKDLIASSRLLHFGTLSMTGEEVSRATKKAVYVAKEAGCIVTFDPNVRPPLWKNKEDIKAAMEFGFSQCDVLKISDNEIEFFTGTSNYHDGIRQIHKLYPNIKLVFATLGPKGSMAFYKDLIIEKEAFIRNDTIETTGAGDSFFGIAINFILDRGLENLNEDVLNKILIYANAGASIITTRKGALCAMPTPDEIEKFLSIAGKY
ncbi:MAG: PfkB family carbohydrate kinase [Oscillospiraceae bacterium]|nr:PfkB family carbohydrate kinase [Oscillospiraceae bacterium]